MSREKKDMQWKFYEYRQGETRHDSSSDKFFDKAPAESLVREFVQNSLDAAVDKPVKITIHEKSLSKGVVAPYLGDPSGLPKHLHACDIKAKGSNIRLVVLEDFNTTGLDGDNLTDFFQSDNRTNKERGGGSHGIGKAIFSASSKTKTFFGYSVYGNNESVLRGRAILKTHELENYEYHPYGDLEIIDAEKHGGFIKGIFTRRKNEKGLSVAIPYCDIDDIELKDIEESCLEQCYLPICQGRLEIRVGDKEFNSQNLLGHIGTPAVNLVMDYKTAPEDQKIKDQVKQSDWKGNKGGDSPLFDRIKKGAEGIKEEADQEQSFFIELEVKLPTKKRNIEYGKVEVLIKKVDEDQEQRFDFWRDDLLITNARRRGLPKGFSAVVMITNNPLSELLRELEDPGHTKWQTGSLPSDVKEKYKYVRELVEFIKRLPIDIINRIKESPINLDKNFFADYFPASSSGSMLNEKGVDEQKYGDQPPGEIDSKLQDFTYIRKRKPPGFTLKLKERENHPDTVTVEAAYVTNIGDPFKNYDRRDFIFRKGIKLSCKHGKRISYSGNSAVYAIKNGDFWLSMTGFDPDRELKIKIT